MEKVKFQSKVSPKVKYTSEVWTKLNLIHQVNNKYKGASSPPNKSTKLQVQYREIHIKKFDMPITQGGKEKTIFISPLTLKLIQMRILELKIQRNRVCNCTF